LFSFSLKRKPNQSFYFSSKNNSNQNERMLTTTTFDWTRARWRENYISLHH